jgi:hypothetical protein
MYNHGEPNVKAGSNREDVKRREGEHENVK